MGACNVGQEMHRHSGTRQRVTRRVRKAGASHGRPLHRNRFSWTFSVQPTVCQEVPTHHSGAMYATISIEPCPHRLSRMYNNVYEPVRSTRNIVRLLWIVWARYGLLKLMFVLSFFDTTFRYYDPSRRVPRPLGCPKTPTKWCRAMGVLSRTPSWGSGRKLLIYPSCHRNGRKSTPASKMLVTVCVFFWLQCNLKMMNSGFWFHLFSRRRLITAVGWKPWIFSTSCRAVLRAYWRWRWCSKCWQPVSRWDENWPVQLTSFPNFGRHGSGKSAFNFLSKCHHGRLGKVIEIPKSVWLQKATGFLFVFFCQPNDAAIKPRNGCFWHP